jgi:hypothetical protein
MDGEPPLPTALRTFIDATNAGDSDAFVAAFTEDAVLDDWGRVFRGHAGIADWNRTDNIGVGSQFDVVGLERTADPHRLVATLRVTGGGYNGTGPITFEFRGDRIARVEIAPA